MGADSIAVLVIAAVADKQGEETWRGHRCCPAMQLPVCGPAAQQSAGLVLGRARSPRSSSLSSRITGCVPRRGPSYVPAPASVKTAQVAHNQKALADTQTLVRRG